MRTKLMQVLGMCLTLTIASNTSYALVEISPLSKKSHHSTQLKRDVSPIEKALSQQKNGHRNYKSKDDIKVLNLIQSKASQNFFAVQNQKFTRFVQNLFAS